MYIAHPRIVFWVIHIFSPFAIFFERYGFLPIHNQLVWGPKHLINGMKKLSHHLHLLVWGPLEKSYYVVQLDLHMGKGHLLRLR